MLPLLLPAVVPEQATLELLAGINKHVLTGEPFPCSPSQRRVPSSKVSLTPPAAKPRWLRQERAVGGAHQTVTFRCGLHQQGSEQANHAMVYLGCIHTCPITLPEPAPLHTMEILLPFFFFSLPSPQISHSEETATEVVHMLSIRHCVATSCMRKLMKLLNLDGFNTCFSHTLFSFLVGPFLSLLDSHILRHICQGTSYGSIFILNDGIF